MTLRSEGKVSLLLSYYKTINGRITPIDNCENGCWINCVAPTEAEINSLIKDFNIEPEFVRAALDEEESSHIDSEAGNTLLIVDIPVVQKQEKNFSYITIPLAIIIIDKHIITICLKDNPIIGEFEDGVIKNIETQFKTQFVLNMMLRITTKYLQYLKQIDKITHHAEQELRKSMKNKELMQLLEIEKSLVYFSSALKSNEITMQKIIRGRLIKLYNEDQDLLDDVLIEVRQAIEMSTIYLNILSSTMDAFSSIISNNLNITMKILASITLIISIPTVISGLYGMNIVAENSPIPFAESFFFPLGLSIVLMGIAAFILKRKDML